MDKIRKASDHVILAKHHLVDIHLPISRRWIQKHLKLAVDEILNFEQTSDPTRSAAVQLRLINFESDSPAYLLEVLEHLDTFLSYHRQSVFPMITRKIHPLIHDLGIGALTLLIVTIGFVFYHDYPVQIFSNQIKIMDVVVESSNQDYGHIQYNKTIEKIPVIIGRKHYQSAIGTHANSSIRIKVTGEGHFLSGGCGYPDSASGATQICRIVDGDKVLVQSPVLNDANRFFAFRVAVPKSRRLLLSFVSMTESITSAHAVWVKLEASR